MSAARPPEGARTAARQGEGSPVSAAPGASAGLEVQVRALHVAGRCLARDLHWVVPAGAVHTLMGPSGCGKSSLLAALCGVADAAVRFEGEIWIKGQRVDRLPTRQRQLGLLFQDDLLFAHMSVRENLLFAVPPGPRAAREAAVAQALQDLHMPQFAHADPATLSGGQRARVALARALLAQPQALLLDEPFSRLDAALRSSLRRHVFETLQRRGVPAILVSHDEADIADPTRLTRWATEAGAG